MATTAQTFEKGKKGVFGATVAPPTQQADFFSQLRNTFERGVVSAEIDISSLWNEKMGMHGARSVGRAEKDRVKHIIAEHGGMATIHAPLGFDFSASMSLSQRKGAQALKETIEYAKEVGAESSITVHPSMLMGASFIDPATGTEQTLPKSYYLCNSVKELDDYIKKHNIKDNLVKKQIEAEWRNFAVAQAAQFQQQNASFAPQTLREFAQNATTGRGMTQFIHELEKKGLGEEAIATTVERRLAQLTEYGASDQITEAAKQALARYNSDPRGFVKLHKDWYEKQINELKKQGHDPTKFEQGLKEFVDSKWASAAAAVGGDLTREGFEASNILGGGPGADKQLMQEVMKTNNLDEETLNTLSPTGALFVRALSGQRRGDMSEDAEKRVRDNFLETMDMFLKDKQVQDMLKDGKTKLNLENLWGSNPEHGMFEGIPYFNDPVKMAEVVKELKKRARENGLSEDIFGVTFDTQHALASGVRDEKTGKLLKPSEWLDRLKAEGVDVDHVHLVGGSEDSKGHVAFGDWNDQLAKTDPELWNKLAETGVINIEGGKGLADVEKTLEAMWNEGVPLEAMAASAHVPEEVAALGYQASAASFYGEQARMYGAMTTKGGLYSFGPSLSEPGLSQFGSSLAPGLYSGGAMHRDISQMSRTYMSAQPLLYSSGGNQS